MGLPVSPKSLLNQFARLKLACLNIIVVPRISNRNTSANSPKNYLTEKSLRQRRVIKELATKTECIKECSNLTTSGLGARTKTQAKNSAFRRISLIFQFHSSLFSLLDISRNIAQQEAAEECCALPCPFGCQFNCIIKAGSLSIDILSNLGRTKRERKTAREMPIKVKEGTHKNRQRIEF